MTQRDVFVKVPEQECQEKQGETLGLRWVGTMKPDGLHRSRLVVREIKKAKAPEDTMDPQTVFIGMPPVERLKLMAVEIMTLDRKRNGKRVPTTRMAIWDVSRTHFSNGAETETERERDLHELPRRDVGDRLPSETTAHDVLNAGCLEHVGETAEKHLKKSGTVAGKNKACNVPWSWDLGILQW